MTEPTNKVLELSRQIGSLSTAAAQIGIASAEKDELLEEIDAIRLGREWKRIEEDFADRASAKE